MTMGIAAGAGVGLGIWLVVRGLRPSLPSLRNALADLDRPRHAAAAPAARWRGQLALWSGSIATAGPADQRRLDRDLAVTDRAIERHALDKLTLAALGFAIPTLFAALAAVGGASIPVGFVTSAALVLGGVAFLYPEVTLRSEAEARRGEFCHALSAYLDLVTITLAGGAGVEGALDSAAQAGDGWAFARLRQDLVVSRLNRESPWAVMQRTADQLGIDQLGELASSISLAGDSGAKVRESLAAKAVSLREHQLAEAHAEAERSTERMAAPVVAMLTGFVLLVGYPAVSAVLDL